VPVSCPLGFARPDAGRRRAPLEDRASMMLWRHYRRGESFARFSYAVETQIAEKLIRAGFVPDAVQSSRTGNLREGAR
jgi:hypothetical protein